MLDKGYEPYKIESYLKELAWRDYLKNVWIEPGSKINDDVKQKMRKVFASFNGLKSFSIIRGGNINALS